MFTITSDSYSYYKSSQTEFSHHRLEHVVHDLKLKLQDPGLSSEERVDLSKRINDIDKRAKANHKAIELAILASDIGNYVSSFISPVAAGAVVLLTEGSERSLRQRKQQKIGKARVIAGKRVESKKGRSAMEKGLTLSSVNAAAIAALSTHALNQISFPDLIGRSWSIVKNLLK